jgi:hypothetical protein
MDIKYNDGGRQDAGYRGTTGDCVCRSIAIASGRPYKEVYDALALGNRNQRRTKREPYRRVRTAGDGISVHRKWFKEYMTSLGFEWISTAALGLGNKVHLNANELPSGRLVVLIHRHMVAVIDGIINDVQDYSKGGTTWVKGYWKFKK